MKISSIKSQGQILNRRDYSYKDQNNGLKRIKSVNVDNFQEKQNPTFKGAGMAMLGMSSSVMQWIENKGYLMSFLIQDGLGMTAPRVWTGFHRDREITGEYNVQEGLEVLGREGLTGPYIIGVAPAVLALTGKFCKSTNTNTRLIKRLGQSLKDMVSNPSFDKSIQKDVQKFKDEFYKLNITKMYKDTVPNDKNSEETIKYLLEQFNNYASKNKKMRNEAVSNIVEKINSKKVETSNQLLSMNQVLVGGENNKIQFGTAEYIRALKDYGEDAIVNNSSRASIDANSADNIKNNFATKRLLTNIANIVVTLGGLSILPKLYAPSDVAPGAKTLKQAAQKNSNEKVDDNKKDSNKDIAFKGKGINSDGIMAKMGKLITKYVPEKMQGLLEYTGYNFTKTTFALLATLGLLLPRGKRAWDRAEIDANGKRDMTEINEILLRDTVSSLSVVFAVPMLTKMLVRSYEDGKGFILTNRASDGKNGFKKFIDIINPYSDLEVLSVADLDAIYGKIDSKDKLLNFSKFVDSKGGDLEKILSHSDEASVVFNDKSFTLDSIRDLSSKEKNKEIISLFEGLKVSSNTAKDETISKLMKSTGSVKNNPIAKMARGLNSLPGFISTVIISPVLLGILIPMLTYHNTRKAHAKKMSEMQNVSK